MMLNYTHQARVDHVVAMLRAIEVFKPESETASCLRNTLYELLVPLFDRRTSREHLTLRTNIATVARLLRMDREACQADYVRHAERFLNDTYWRAMA